MTFSSAELIEALRRRRRRSLRPERPAGEFPPGWAAWFESMQARAGAVTGATAEAILAIFRAREPALPPRALAALGRWQAFNTLWRQQWHPASADERGLRIFASAVTLLVHLFLAVFLLYLAYVRFMGLPAQADASAGEDVIQVEYIGDGTPDEAGGGPPADAASRDAAAAAAAAAGTTSTAPAGSTAQAAAAASAASAAREQAAAPAPAPRPQAPPANAPPVEQPLQVTDVATPDESFALPPPRPIDLPQPTTRVPDLAAPAPRLEVVEIPSPVAAPAVRPRAAAPVVEVPRLQQRQAEVAQRTIPTPLATPDVRPQAATPAVEAPALQQQADVRMRDIPAPLSPAPVAALPARPSAAPELRADAPRVAERSIPAPRPASTAASNAAGDAPSRAPAAAEAGSAQRDAGAAKAASTTAAPAAGARPGATAAGAGTTASSRPGALPSPRRGDDWGVSDRNRPGGQAGTPGLFNADGTPKLAGGGKVGGGLPPGTITEDFAKIDRNGTWLKRPPVDYTPTEFDRFWVPNETLLEEWVRRSIKEVLIPIPGTSKTITCSVVLLALGGACDITDPNMQDVEATARKPPDVPFKPELQEDQDALARPPGTPPGIPPGTPRGQ